MIRVFVDSGSSIKKDEVEKYNVEIIPLKILLGNKEYLDGENLSIDEFYHQLIDEKQFPKTSLPDLVALEEKVNKYTEAGDDVLIVTISSKISGTYNAFKMLFEDNNKVTVIDSRCAVGGMRLIVDEINKYRDREVSFILKKIHNLIPRIKIMAIPETLLYLLRGGRLSKTEWLLGSILQIKPIIGFEEGKVHVLSKKRGIKKGMQYIVESLSSLECDPEYDIIASYTYNKDNLDNLIAMTDEKYKSQIRVFDNLDPAIACHWGPNAFGYIFIGKK
ncbi:MAG: DegV family protein [Anaeroplasma sp.]